MLFDLVKESKSDTKSMQTLIELFEPKLIKSLSHIKHEEREDLAQELKCIMIQYIRKYNVDSTPGFWEMKEKIRDNIN